MKTCLFLLLLLGGCVSDAVTSPMPVLGTPNAVVRPMPDFPAPLASIRATNAYRMPYRDFLPQDATNVSNAYQNGSRGKRERDAWLAMAYKGDTNQIEAYKERSELHKAYLRWAFNHDTNAAKAYLSVRTNEAEMSRLYGTNYERNARR